MAKRLVEPPTQVPSPHSPYRLKKNENRNLVRKTSYRAASSKYDPKYCDMLIAHCAAGFSYSTFAPKIGVQRQTTTEWCDQFPEFNEARMRAEAQLDLWHEEEAMAHAKGERDPRTLTGFIWRSKNVGKWRDQPIDPATQAILPPGQASTNVLLIDSKAAEIISQYIRERGAKEVVN